MVFCGIDIGTTSTKAIALDGDGQVIDKVTVSASGGPRDTAGVYWHDHFSRALDFFAAKSPFRSDEIICSVTGQGGSFVLTDDRCRPLGGACSWTVLADDAVVQDLADAFGQTAYYHLTGWPPHGWLAASKLRQMVEREQIPPNARRVATVPDFVYAQMTGQMRTDITSAQITGWADFQKAQWSGDVLHWIGIHEELLPKIVQGPSILAERVRVPWGKITLVTGSHDQYAAMEAAGLARDTSAMVGTGTAWVINGRATNCMFDDERFLVHPGRDLCPDCYGFIVTLWQIGAGFDRLLGRLGVTRASLAELEDLFAGVDVPRGPVAVDLDKGVVEPAGDAAMSVRRYMEWAGSVVAHALDGCGLTRRLERIIVTGGAMSSRFWPQVIADICGLAVEAIDCPHFTAYGAALHARRAFVGSMQSQRFPGTAIVRTYSPQQSQQYRAWYLTSQKPILEAQTI